MGAPLEAPLVTGLKEEAPEWVASEAVASGEARGGDGEAESDAELACERRLCTEGTLLFSWGLVAFIEGEALEAGSDATGAMEAPDKDVAEAVEALGSEVALTSDTLVALVAGCWGGGADATSGLT